MPIVDVAVNGRSYSVQCGAGEEDRLHRLAGWVDAKVKDAAGEVGDVGEARLLVLTLLRTADAFFDIADSVDDPRLEDGPPASTNKGRTRSTGLDEKSLEALRRATNRIKALTESLPEPTTDIPNEKTAAASDDTPAAQTSSE